MTVRMIIILLSLTVLFGQKKIARVDHPPIDEQSSLIKSKTYDDVYWVSNDSDTKPYLFPLTLKGEIIVPILIVKSAFHPIGNNDFTF